MYLYIQFECSNSNSMSYLVQRSLRPLMRRCHQRTLPLLVQGYFHFSTKLDMVQLDYCIHPDMSPLCLLEKECATIHLDYLVYDHGSIQSKTNRFVQFSNLNYYCKELLWNLLHSHSIPKCLCKQWSVITFN